MKKTTLLICMLCFASMQAQEHFSAITTSKRVGIVNGNMNPSEFSNLNSRFEFQFFTTSFNISNNKVGFSDIVDGKNLEDLIFEGDGTVDFNIDAEILGPSFAMRLQKWGFAITSKAFVKANVIDVDTHLGDALSNSALNSILAPSIISSNNNQRINATVWGEVGFSVARKIYENEKHRINGGVTFKLLFPGAYANIGLDKFQGTITNTLGDIRLNDANARMNIAYSGSLGENFTETSDYFNSLFGNLKGMATDIGFDYQWKTGPKSYKLKIGASVRNIGSMTFKDSDNVSKNYELNINDAPGGGLDLNEFNDVEGLDEIEDVLQNHPEYFTETDSKNEFKVKLPTVFNAYADIKVVSKLSLTLFMQQRMGDASANDQISSQNSFSVTPRVSLGPFEVFVPVGFNEVSDTTGGFGFRLGGFFLGSNSILTAVTSDSKQADIYTGFRFGFL